MKKIIFYTLFLTMLLSFNANAAIERIGGYVGFDTIEEHNQEVLYSSEDDEYEDHEDDYEEHNETLHAQNMLGMASSEDGYGVSSLEMEEYDSQDHTHRIREFLESIEEVLEDRNASFLMKEVAREIKYAVEFYKKDNLFVDLNITDLEECNISCLEELRQRARVAYEHRKKELAQKILKFRERMEYRVAGYFVKMGEGQYDWAFVLPDGTVYKLVGVDETGHFKYEKLDGKAQITTSGYVYLPGAVSGEGFLFVNYDDLDENGFDWVIVTSDGKLYKLEGYDNDAGTFVYTPVEGVMAQPQGDEVVVLPGT